MFSRTKNSTTVKIEAISALWSVLLIAMLATTFTLYGEKDSGEYSQPQMTFSTQKPISSGIR